MPRPPRNRPAPEPEDTKPASRVASGASVALPPRMTAPEGVTVGVQTSGRRPAVVARKRLVRAMSAAEASKLFPKGGSAFTAWCAREKGLTATERRTEAEWADLLTEFAARPIHGHRRAQE